MKRVLNGFLVSIAFFHVSAPSTQAGVIERACITAARQAASGQLCDCIQQVADQMLTRSEQRLAAKFFERPHKAQEIRQSDNARHEAFWLRYKEFGVSAAATCD
jgi:hypothetical protein